MIRRTPIRRVSKKRSKALALYSKLRKQFLEEHPWCQWWIAENDQDESAVFETNGLGLICREDGSEPKIVSAPRATEIHHKKKPKSTYLNDTSTWMAVSRTGHEWIENNKREARAKGYLENI